MSSSSRSQPCAGHEASAPSAAHTPGPWQNGFDDLEGVVSLGSPDDGNVVCLPPDATMELSLTRWPANARLIAAAPDLLAHLRFAVKLLSALPGLSGTAQVEAMRNAIAAATGNTAPQSGPLAEGDKSREEQ